MRLNGFNRRRSGCRPPDGCKLLPYHRSPGTSSERKGLPCLAFTTRINPEAVCMSVHNRLRGQELGAPPQHRSGRGQRKISVTDLFPSMTSVFSKVDECKHSFFYCVLVHHVFVESNNYVSSTLLCLASVRT